MPDSPADQSAGPTGGTEAHIAVPARLRAACRADPPRAAWLARLPAAVADLRRRWRLTLGTPFDGPEVSCSWVAPATGADGSAAVLKLGMPHMENLHELDGLLAWAGEPSEPVVRVLQADHDLPAMLLERCLPGTPLRALDEPEQDVVIARLLLRMRRVPVPPHPFRPLSAMSSDWSRETLAAAARWPDAGLVEAGLRVLGELHASAPPAVLLATDLHAGNVLATRRQPWLVIDPKPFAGDPAYDATQHLLNCYPRMLRQPLDTIRRFADLVELDPERVRLWMFARAAADPRKDWTDPQPLTLARALAP